MEISTKHLTEEQAIGLKDWSEMWREAESVANGVDYNNVYSVIFGIIYGHIKYKDIGNVLIVPDKIRCDLSKLYSPESWVVDILNKYGFKIKNASGCDCTFHKVPKNDKRITLQFIQEGVKIWIESALVFDGKVIKGRFIPVLESLGLTDGS